MSELQIFIAALLVSVAPLNTIANRLRIPFPIVLVFGRLRRPACAPPQHAGEGEALVNDATALVAYKVAVAAAVGEGFSASHAGLEFLCLAAGGIVVGLVVGCLLAEIRKRLDDSMTEATMSLSAATRPASRPTISASPASSPPSPASVTARPNCRGRRPACRR